MANLKEMRAKMDSLGFSKEELLRKWFEVYVLSTVKEDLHAKFANALCCSRNDAKIFSYILQYMSPYLKHSMLSTGISRLEMAKMIISKKGSKVEAENALQKHIDHLEKQSDKYFEEYRTINPDAIK